MSEGAERRTRLMVIDPMPLARKALSDALRDSRSVEVVGTASGVALAQRRLDAVRPEVILFDAQPPLAPEIAAREAGIEIRHGVLVSAFERLHAAADVVVVEGVGGWAAPLSAQLDQADLVRSLRLPVVLVVGMRLGCINHARLTARAVEADGARLVGWIASDVDPAMARADDNFRLLQGRLPLPCWGRLRH